MTVKHMIAAHTTSNLTHYQKELVCPLFSVSVKSKSFAVFSRFDGPRNLVFVSLVFKEVVMKARIEYDKVSPDVLKRLMPVEHYVHNSGLEGSLLELVKMRASQINGCAFCIDMHSKDARANGETEQRLYALDAWRETPFYSDRERAALAWTEAVTLITNGHVPDAVFDTVRQQFSEEELVNLTLAVAMINTWNRLSIAFRVVPGTYQPQITGAAAS